MGCRSTSPHWAKSGSGRAVSVAGAPRRNLRRRRCAADQTTSVLLDILRTDPTAGAGAGNLVDIHSQLAGQLANRGGRRDRHGGLCAPRREQRPAVALRRQVRPALSPRAGRRSRLRRVVPAAERAGFSRGSSAARAGFCRLPLGAASASVSSLTRISPTLTVWPGLTSISVIRAPLRRGHLERRLLRLQLDHRLVLLHHVPHRNQNRDDLSGLDVLRDSPEE